MIKLSDYVMQFVVKLGVKHVFMLPGGGSMHLVDSLGKCDGLEYICNLHEQASAIAAEAYAQYTNNIGVALVTTGPGGTNTITGVASAWLDSIPCLFISGQVKRADMVGERAVRQMGFQELNIAHLVKPVTKYAVTVVEPESIGYHLEKAVYMANSGRPGPVWIDIPLDVQATMIDDANLVGFEPDKEIKPSKNKYMLQRQVNKAILLLNQADRPVILVGNGVRLAKAQEDFLHLIDILKVPILTTWKAADFLPESNRLFVGRPGSVGQRGANFAQQNSDWIMTIGARLDFGQIGYDHSNFAREAKKVVVDIDPAEIDKIETQIDIPICADAKEFIEKFIRQSKEVEIKDHSDWLAKCKSWQRRYPVVVPEYYNEQGCVNNYALIEVLSEEMTGDDLLVPGSSGACSERTMQAFKIKDGMRVFNSEGLGAMGFGIAASIGGCVASGRKRTVCIDGDGGFQLNIQELETVKRLDLPIKFFVLNNHGYGSIKATQQNYFGGHLVACDPSSGLTLPNILKIAAAYGITANSIRSNSELKQKVRQVLDSNGPVLCEVVTSPEQMTAPRISSRQLANGQMISTSLEDLWPFLDRKEFLSNMITSPLNIDG